MLQCLRSGQPFPEKIANAPKPWVGLGLYFNAFQELSTARSVGFSLGPIPWTAVDAYARRYHLSEDEFESMIYHIREMDSAYLEFHREKAEAGRNR